MVIKQGEQMLATDITDLTFFPKGTILTFSSAAWSATSTKFKDIWKVCNGQNGTPNLVNKFLRGAESSGENGGSNTATISLEIKHLPAHRHLAPTMSGQSGIHETAGTMSNGYDHYPEAWTSETGGNQPYTIGTVPVYYTVIYIIKVV